MITIDLNCDIGESFGIWRMGNDEALMDWVSSVNVACGFHAGDPSVIRKTIQTAIQKGVAIGAHPSFPDLQGFGRREMKLPEEEVFDLVLYQVSALKGICEALGGQLHHVKPHGALYNQAAKNSSIARAIAEAVKSIDKNLILFGLSGSFLISEAENLGLKTASEVFADRTYQPDGTLTPRNFPNAVIKDTSLAIAQAIQMITTKTVTATNGEKIPIKAETVCIHGDGEKALDFARNINLSLKKIGVTIKPIAR
ncbi:MAG: LamB/YcsF family protein [Pyrinomonadaceae bacterium]|nr:LamB/YcsF family protein [Pyrinomonadaceae bacterium]MDW8305003.1 5-oxoprolinase subunit PxpA [Acidobacteriota bacterium]